MSHRTRIKICGLTREEDVLSAVQAGADAIGLVFYAASARCVSLARAEQLVALLPPFVTPVGLFVNANLGDIRRATDAIPHLVLQFHGDETPTQCDAAGHPYLRAARMQVGLNLVDFSTQFANAQALLLDAHVEGFGGGGKVFDWSLIPPHVRHPVVLSGGLHAKNVAEGILQVRPWAVDVSSGVESAKGIKDPEAIYQFCQAVRDADQQVQRAALNPKEGPHV